MAAAHTAAHRAVRPAATATTRTHVVRPTRYIMSSQFPPYPLLGKGWNITITITMTIINAMMWHRTLRRSKGRWTSVMPSTPFTTIWSPAQIAIVTAITPTPATTGRIQNERRYVFNNYDRLTNNRNRRRFWRWGGLRQQRASQGGERHPRVSQQHQAQARLPAYSQNRLKPSHGD